MAAAAFDRHHAFQNRPQRLLLAAAFAPPALGDGALDLARPHGAAAGQNPGLGQQIGGPLETGAEPVAMARPAAGLADQEIDGIGPAGQPQGAGAAVDEAGEKGHRAVVRRHVGRDLRLHLDLGAKPGIGRQHEAMVGRRAHQHQLRVQRDGHRPAGGGFGAGDADGPVAQRPLQEGPERRPSLQIVGAQHQDAAIGAMEGAGGDGAVAAAAMGVGGDGPEQAGGGGVGLQHHGGVAGIAVVDQQIGAVAALERLQGPRRRLVGVGEQVEVVQDVGLQLAEPAGQLAMGAELVAQLGERVGDGFVGQAAFDAADAPREVALGAAGGGAHGGHRRGQPGQGLLQRLSPGRRQRQQLVLAQRLAVAAVDDQRQPLRPPPDIQAVAFGLAAQSVAGALQHRFGLVVGGAHLLGAGIGGEVAAQGVGQDRQQLPQAIAEKAPAPGRQRQGARAAGVAEIVEIEPVAGGRAACRMTGEMGHGGFHAARAVLAQHEGVVAGGRQGEVEGLAGRGVGGQIEQLGLAGGLAVPVEAAGEAGRGHRFRTQRSGRHRRLAAMAPG